jgi:hypothetical protein
MENLREVKFEGFKRSWQRHIKMYLRGIVDKDGGSIKPHQDRVERRASLSMGSEITQLVRIFPNLY